MKFAAPKKIKPQQDDASAHPDANNFDPSYANSILGDLAEEVRSYLADKHDARPPGLQTIQNDDGSLTVRADNPDAGLGIEVKISMLGAAAPTEQAPSGSVPADPMAQGGGGFGVGPQMPPPMNQSPAMPPAAPQQPFGVGPQMPPPVAAKRK